MLRQLWRRWRERRELRRRIVEEIRFHLAEATDQRIEAGVPPNAAREVAALRLGDGQAIVKECLCMMEEEPAVPTKGFGIPAAAYATAAVAVPVLLAGLLIPNAFRSLPLRNADQLAISTHRVAQGFALAHEAPAGVAAFVRAIRHVGWPEESAQVFAGQEVSANFFRLQGEEPFLGSGFTSSPAREIVLSYRLWREGFGADPRIVGRIVPVERRLYRVVGIMPREYWFLNRDDRFWVRTFAAWGKEESVTLLTRIEPDLLERVEIPGTRVRWVSLERASAGIFDAALGIAGAAVFLLAGVGLLQTWSLWRVLEQRRKLGWTLLRNYLFLFAKAVPLVATFGILWLAVQQSELLAPASYFAGASAMMSTFVFAMLCVAAVWHSLVDQRLRCLVCLRKLSMPLPQGMIGSILFQLPGTEYICAYGHGTLYVPEPTSEGLREIHWNPPSGVWAELLESSAMPRG